MSRQDDLRKTAQRLHHNAARPAESVPGRKMGANCGRKVMYAHVPQRPSICGFCCIMAANGFIYSADAKTPVHNSCTCAFLPEGSTPKSYDPASYRERYDLCKETVSRLTTYDRWVKSGSAKSYADWKTEQIVAEMDTRDGRWLASGRPSDITFESEWLEADIRKNHKRELDSAKRLRKLGVKTDFAVDFRDCVEDGTGRKFRIGRADFADGTELKCLQNTASKNTIKGYLDNTSKKENARAVIFDNSTNPNLSDTELINLIMSNPFSFKRGRVYVYSHEGQLIRVR